jgi:uncharacterized ferredoxin-like protein
LAPNWHEGGQKSGTRELAKTVGVNAGTMSRWRKDSEFQQMVNEAEDTVKLWERMAEEDEKKDKEWLLQRRAARGER